MVSQTKNHFSFTKYFSFIYLILMFFLVGCGSNSPAISTENIDQVSWLKTYPVSNLKAWGDVVWSTHENEQLFVAGSLGDSDGNAVGYVYSWNTNYEDGESYDWRTMDGKVIFGYPIRSMALSPDGRRIALGSYVGVVLIWDMDFLPAEDNIFYLEGHSEPTIPAVAWSPDGKLLASGGTDKTVRIWNVDSDILTQGSSIEEVMRFEVTEKINCVSFSPGGELIVIGTDDGIASINIETQTIVLDVSGDPLAKLGQSLAWSSDGTMLAVGSLDGKVFVFSFAGDQFDSNTEFHSISTNGSIVDLDFSPDGKMFVLAFKNSLRIWNLEEKETIRSFSNSNDLYFTSVAWSPDGRFIATTYTDGTLRIIGVE
ncbi:MAG: hypothetical protein JEZ06_15140 [Anaerolineaceae bacterium]|nr:hypothetical protein [Anaerolineaceae bacterium]